MLTIHFNHVFSQIIGVCWMRRPQRSMVQVFSCLAPCYETSTAIRCQQDTEMHLKVIKTCMNMSHHCILIKKWLRLLLLRIVCWRQRTGDKVRAEAEWKGKTLVQPWVKTLPWSWKTYSKTMTKRNDRHLNKVSEFVCGLFSIFLTYLDSFILGSKYLCAYVYKEICLHENKYLHT